jgi:hypothetical protein
MKTTTNIGFFSFNLICAVKVNQLCYIKNFVFLITSLGLYKATALAPWYIAYIILLHFVNNSRRITLNHIGIWSSLSDTKLKDKPYSLDQIEPNKY